MLDTLFRRFYVSGVLWAVSGCIVASATSQDTRPPSYDGAQLSETSRGEPDSVERLAIREEVPAPLLEESHAPSLCSSEMALIPGSDGKFCIDRFEASIVRGTSPDQARPWPGNMSVDGIESDIVAVTLPDVKPQGFISGAQAGIACERAGKRLCSSEEWVTACRGPNDTRYPYGHERRANVCNDRFKGLDLHPVVRLFRAFAPAGTDDKLMWTAPWVNDPRLHELSHTVALTGSFDECVNEYGVADMVGNLHEWVADRGGVFRGGFFMDTHQHGEGCEYRTSAHRMSYHDYSTGFRCCADVAP